MIFINKASERKHFGHGNFNVQVTFPGLALHSPADVGLVNLGRVDHAVLMPGVLVKMHPHVNDEILSYVKKGTMLHKDSEGHTEQISNTHLMMMNAGTGIYHEESIPENLFHSNVEMLQVFIRPEQKGAEPKVQFASLPDEEPNKWRLVAGFASAPLMIRSEIYVWDASVNFGSIELPYSPFAKTTVLLYVFNGGVDLNEQQSLTKGDSAIILYDEKPIIHALDAEVVAFVMNTEAAYTREGMFSGMN